MSGSRWGRWLIPRAGLLLVFMALGRSAVAQPFYLPTANRALFQPGGEERFFVGTPGKPWTSGTFGCVRSEGFQFHEGLDIRSIQRDARGEPVDPVLATAEGTVAYLNRRPSLSNYGNYVILRHQVGGVEVYSLYAHLREIRADLRIGQAIKAEEKIGVLGRTANTRTKIAKDRAHVHFEIDLMLNERFPDWYRRTFPGQRNDHGIWNGQNMVGLDARLVLLAQRQEGVEFRLIRFMRDQTELCRVAVRETHFSWLTRFPGLVRANAVSAREGVAGYEIALNYAGLPFELIPRAASELKGSARVQLLSVNEVEQRQRACRNLVVRRKGRWELGADGTRLVGLLLQR